jgi:hypothetical protein
VLDIDLDLRISGVVSLGGGEGRNRYRIEQVPRGVLRTRRAPGADTTEGVRAERQAVRSPSGDESLRLLPYSGGSGAGSQGRQVDRRDREIRTPNIEAAEPEFQNELTEAEQLLKSLASALALRLLSQAATKTRQAIAKAKRAIRSKDPERIRQANERLREAATRLTEALRRVRGAEAMATADVA